MALASPLGAPAAAEVRTVGDELTVFWPNSYRLNMVDGGFVDFPKR